MKAKFKSYDIITDEGIKFEAQNIRCHVWTEYNSKEKEPKYFWLRYIGQFPTKCIINYIIKQLRSRGYSFAEMVDEV